MMLSVSHYTWGPGGPGRPETPVGPLGPFSPEAPGAPGDPFIPAGPCMKNTHINILLAHILYKKKENVQIQFIKDYEILK